MISSTAKSIDRFLDVGVLSVEMRRDWRIHGQDWGGLVILNV